MSTKYWQKPFTFKEFRLLLLGKNWGKPLIYQFSAPADILTLPDEAHRILQLVKNIARKNTIDGKCKENLFNLFAILICMSPAWT